MLERIKSKRLTMSELLSIAANIYKQNIKTAQKIFGEKKINTKKFFTSSEMGKI